MAAEDIDLDAEPEEGAVGELAAAMDALQAAEELAARAEKEFLRAKDNVKDLEEELDSAKSLDTPKACAELEKNLDRARQEAEKAFRKTGKAQAKAKAAAQTVQQLGGPAPPPGDP
jgi:hypothetical protein